MIPSRLAVLTLALLSAACAQDYENPFTRFSLSRPPSADAVLIYVSGAWASAPGQPRELFAVDAGGSKAERLTSCTQEATSCDILQASASPDSARITAVRTSPGGEPGASALYFMDLSRSVESVIVPSSQATAQPPARSPVQGVDWSSVDDFLVYSAAATGDLEDLYYALPNGSEDRNLTDTEAVRERSPRIDPFGRTAIYERIDDTGKGRIFELPPVRAVTAGGPGTEALPGTPYVVGSDADPDYSPDGRTIVFRRLTGTGNGGLGTWDVMTVLIDGSQPTVIVTGGLYRGPPDWGPSGIVFVETDAGAGDSRLVVLQPDGSGRQVLLTQAAGFNLGSPRWLP